MHFEAINFGGSKFSNIRIMTSIDEIVLKWLTYNCIMTNPWEKNRESYIYICCKEYICSIIVLFIHLVLMHLQFDFQHKNFHLRKIKTNICRSEKKTSRTAPGSSPQVLNKKKQQKNYQTKSPRLHPFFFSNPSAARWALGHPRHIWELWCPR